MGKIRAIVWDLDGTLLYTMDDLSFSVNAALAEHGFPCHSRDEVRMMVGNGVRKLIERAIPGGEGNEKFPSVYDAFIRTYAAHSKDKTQPYSGIPELLDECLHLGISHAVVSNKVDFAVRELCRTYFGDRIGTTIGDAPDRARKPNPDGVFAAMHEMGTSQMETLYIGDSDVDMLTAKNAGLFGIGVLWGFRDRENLAAAGAGAIVATPEELLAKIKELNR